jgi:hypothetical protein
MVTRLHHCVSVIHTLPVLLLYYIYFRRVCKEIAKNCCHYSCVILPVVPCLLWLRRCHKFFPLSTFLSCFSYIQLTIFGPRCICRPSFFSVSENSCFNWSQFSQCLPTVLPDDGNRFRFRNFVSLFLSIRPCKKSRNRIIIRFQRGLKVGNLNYCNMNWILPFNSNKSTN